MLWDFNRKDQWNIKWNGVGVMGESRDIEVFHRLFSKGKSYLVLQKNFFNFVNKRFYKVSLSRQNISSILEFYKLGFAWDTQN